MKSKFKRSLSTAGILFLMLFAVANSYGQAALALHEPKGFIENKGQIHNQHLKQNKSVQYLRAASNGLNIQLRSDGFAYDTYQKVSGSNGEIEFHRIDVRFLNANPEAILRGELPEASYQNFYNPYYTNLNAENVQSFGKVVYENIYDGIDLHVMLTPDDGNFKYDFVAKPGANLSAIQVEYSGYDHAEVGDDAIIFDVSGRQLIESIPVSYTLPGNDEVKVKYQTISKAGGKLVVGYNMESNSSYSASKTLVIDPLINFSWSTYYGDSLYDVGYAVATDTVGNVFAAGATSSLQAMASEGSFQNNYAGGDLDAYLVRFNQHGLRQWATYYGGSGSDLALGLHISVNDYVYMVGATTSVDSIGGEGTLQPANAGSTDGFAAKFSRHGTLIWDTFIGGSGDDMLTSCYSLFSGELLIAGETNSSDMSLPETTFSQGYSGGMDAFAVRLNPAGLPVWATYFGGPNDETCGGIVQDETGFVFLAGATQSQTGIASGNALQTELTGETDGYIVSLNPDGLINWSTYYGGPEQDAITGIAVANGYTYVCGSTNSNNAFTDSLSHQAEFGGVEDAFVAKLDSESATLWYSFLGGDELDRAHAVSTDRDGHAYITGVTRSQNGIDPNDSTGTSHNGLDDVFISKFLESGELEWSSYYGGDGDDAAYAIVVYGYTAVYFTGGTSSADSVLAIESPVEEMVHQGLFGGGERDGFVARITQNKSTPPPNICVCPGGGGGSGSSEYTPYLLGLCLGESLTLNLQGGCIGNDAEWVWYESACGETDAYLGEGNSLTVTPTQTTTYFVRGESVWDVSACSSVTVYVDTIVPAIVDPAFYIACENGLLFLTSTSVGAVPLDYYWYNNADSLTGSLMQSVVDSLTLDGSGEWYLVVETQFGCIDTTYFPVTVNPAPVYVAVISHPTCEGREDGFIAFTPGASQTLEVYMDTLATAELYYDSLGAGYYNFTIINNYNCQAFNSIVLFPPTNPVDSLQSVTAWCDNADGSLLLFLNGEVAPYTVIWNDGAYFGENLNSIPGGDYAAQIFDANQCPFEYVGFVDNQGFFTAIIEPDSLTIDYQTSVELLVTTLPTPEGLTYLWEPEGSLSCFDCPDPTAIPFSSIWYTVLVQSGKGCTSSDSVFVFVIVPPSQAFMPTIFSPNGDGLNDQLCVLGDRIVQLTLEIYNRWGERVFSANSPGQCWDGQYMGSPVNSGILVYSLRLSLDDGEVIEESGNLNIIR